MSKTKIMKAAAGAWEWMKVVGGVAVVLGMLAWAGTSDYEEECVREMKDNGAYWQLSQEYPHLSDAELVKVYHHEPAKEEQCPN